MTQRVHEVSDPLLQWVTFHLGKESYGIDVMQVQEVLKLSEISPVPGAPDFVLGIINLRGNVVTVVDTRKRFGLGPVEFTEATRIVIVEVEGHVVGLLVDSVAEVVDLRASAIEMAPNVGSDDSAKYIQGVATVAGQLLILIDLKRLLTENELLDLQAFS